MSSISSGGPSPALVLEHIQGCIAPGAACCTPASPRRHTCSRSKFFSDMPGKEDGEREAKFRKEMFNKTAEKWRERMKEKNEDFKKKAAKFQNTEGEGSEKNEVGSSLGKKAFLKVTGNFETK